MRQSSDPLQKQVFLVLAGPVGAGKSSTAAALAAHLRALGLAAANIDLDLIYCMVRQRDGFDDEHVWQGARCGAAALARVFFQTGVRVVVVEGGFYTEGERRDLAEGLGTNVQLLAVTLQISFDGALRRIQADADPGRVASRNPAILRGLHDQYLAALPYLARHSTLVEPDELPMPEVVNRIAALVLEACGTDHRLSVN